MRWMLWKKAWRLASSAFPGKKVWVNVPFRVSSQGSMDVYDRDTKKPIGKIDYNTASKAGKTIISISAGQKEDEIVVPYAMPRSFRVQTAKVTTAVPPEEPTEAQIPHFHVNERVRMADGSMEHGELATIIDIIHVEDGHDYLVLVDGSSQPVEVREDDIRKNKAGAPPKK